MACEEVLADFPKENYAIAHFSGKRWESMSNALLESFNAMVSYSRCMLLMDLLEDIRVRLMDLLSDNNITFLTVYEIDKQKFVVNKLVYPYEEEGMKI